MKNQQRETFTQAFTHVKTRLQDTYNYNMEKCSDDAIRSVSFDYEIALREEYTSILEIDECNGCFMHFSSNIYKNGLSYGLKDALNYEIKRNRPFIYAFNKIKCLGLLPEEKQLTGWTLVQDELINTVPYGYKKIVKRFITDYFQLWYVSGIHFGQKDWLFHRSANRTQACIEVQHRNWHQKIRSHPLLWRFIEFLTRQDALAELRYEQIQAHNGKTRLKRVNERHKEDSLTRLWDMLDAGDKILNISQFLSLASVTIKMNWKVLDKLLADYNKTYYYNSGDY